MIPGFERAKTVHALDRATTVIGIISVVLGDKDSGLVCITTYGLAKPDSNAAEHQNQ
jgi:hypothetical protein